MNTGRSAELSPQRPAAARSVNDNEVAVLSRPPSNGSASNSKEVTALATSPTYDSSQAPLNCKVLRLVRSIRTTIGRCAVSGSAALCELLYQKDLSHTTDEVRNLRSVVQHNDIDLFVPYLPNLQKIVEGKAVDEEEKYSTFRCLFVTKVLPNFDISGFQPQEPEIEVGDDEAENTENALHYRYTSLWPGIREILQLTLPGVEAQVQIVVLDRVVLPCQGYWDNVIPMEFDINVVKLRVDCEGSRKEPPKISFVDETAEDCLQRAEYIYKVPPAQSYNQCAKRICKYNNKGFSLRTIIFDDRIPTASIKHWVDHAHMGLLGCFLWQMVVESQHKKTSCVAKRQRRDEEVKGKGTAASPLLLDSSGEESSINSQASNVNLNSHQTNPSVKPSTTELSRDNIAVVAMLVQPFLPKPDEHFVNRAVRLQVHQERQRLCLEDTYTDLKRKGNIGLEHNGR